MFVEVVRLLVVAVATAGGYVLAGRGRPDPGNAPALGATLGALVGYVAGGVFGRQLRRTMGRVEDELSRVPAAGLLAGSVGACALGALAALVGAPAVALIPGRWGWPVFALVVWVGVFEGFRIAMAKSTELLALAGLRAVPSGPAAGIEALNVVDTSALIDGRLKAVVEAGFLAGTLVVPRFVLDELQAIADSGDGARRRRGRRGLEVLDALRRDGLVGVEVAVDEVPEVETVDAKLVALARRLGAGLVTTDAALAGVAELQGVRCRNLHRLAAGMRPAVVPGEVLRLPISREGKEPGQGVGFLEDGTMVVVGGAAGMVGRDVRVRVTSHVQTAVGRMLFATVADE
jgi:uncharacterized protein YacL